MTQVIKINNEVQTISDKDIENFLFTSNTKLDSKQKTMFVTMAKMHNLNPFKREIYAIPYGKEFNIVTGYQVYLQRAESTGLLNGWTCDSIRSEDGKLLGAKITIYRKDFEHPFKWEVSMTDFAKNFGSWKNMPEFMIKKVAMGQGFRLAFPNELGGMPYLAEELEGAEYTNNKPTEIIETNEDSLNSFNVIIKEFQTYDELKSKMVTLRDNAIRDGIKKEQAESIIKKRLAELK